LKIAGGDEHLLHMLKIGTLVVCESEFAYWYKAERRRNRWPSQHSSTKKRGAGRPTKRTALRSATAEVLRQAGQISVANLRRILIASGRTDVPSVDTLARLVDQLHRETGEPNFLIVDDYMRYRGETTALAVDIKARRAIARAWNASRKLPGWPQQALTEPPLKANTDWPKWWDFPACLQEETETYLTSLTKPRRGIDKKRLGACKLSTIRTRRNDIVSFAKKAVRLGVSIDSLTSMQNCWIRSCQTCHRLRMEESWRRAQDHHHRPWQEAFGNRPVGWLC
jgi:hypothetical protein